MVTVKVALKQTNRHTNKQTNRQGKSNIPPDLIGGHKNDEYPPKARRSEYFDELFEPFSSCMLMEQLEHVHVMELLEHNALIVLIVSGTNQIYPFMPISGQ